MARKSGTYYLGRVHKGGSLDDSKLINAIQHSERVVSNKFAWRFIDRQSGAIKYKNKSYPYIFAKLSKYAPDGMVDIVDESINKKKSKSEPYLAEAESPFIYIPDFSLISYMHIWNKLEERYFRKRFADIVESHYGHFFVDCKIQPITDMRQFVIKLRHMESFVKIKATVQPPNPLFGRFWKPLKDYLDRRNADTVTIHEESNESKPLNTNIPKYVEYLENDEHIVSKPKQKLDSIDIGDAAILMAADGYGKAQVEGYTNEAYQVIKTSDNIYSYKYLREPDPASLALHLVKIAKNMNKRRMLKH